MRLFAVILFASLFAAADVAPESASALLAAGRVDDAISTLQSRISASPNDAEAHNLLCRAYYELGDWDRSISACEKAVALAPNNGRYHLWLGRSYGEKADSSNFLTAAGLAKKVRTEFERAVQLSPDDVAARADLAQFYVEAPGIVGGGKDKAEAQAQALLKLDPGKAHWVKARLAEKAKDMALAEKEYRAAIDSSSNNAVAWLDLAMFYRRVGRLDDMESAIIHATSSQSDQSEVLVDAAQTLIRAGRNLAAAIQMLEKYLAGVTIEEFPAFKAHYVLGTVLEKQGDKKAAAQQYRAALSLAKSFTPAQDALNRTSR